MKRYLVGVFVFISVAVSISIAFSVQAQQTKKIPQAGYLAFVESPDLDGAFRKGLKELGYAEGRNIHIEYRYAGAKPERLSGLAGPPGGPQMDRLGCLRTPGAARAPA